MSPRVIRVRGAREHNLRDIDVDIPLGRFVVVTGVSGSGKSSLVLDTLHREGQRRMLDALGGGGRRLPRPDVALVDGLPPTIAVPARPPARARDTVARLTEVDTLLQLLFARQGALRCPACGALHPHHRPDEIAGALVRFPEGSRVTLLAPVARGRPRDLAGLLDEIRSGGFARVQINGEQHRVDEVPASPGPWDVDLVVDRFKAGPERIARIHEGVRTALLAGDGRLSAVVGRDGAGVPHSWATAPWCPTHDRRWPTPAPLHFDPGRVGGACPTCAGQGRVEGAPCPACGGEQLAEPGRLVELGGLRLPALLAADGPRARAWAAGLDLPAALAPWREELLRRLAHLADLGLGHLALGRATDAMSTSERHGVWLAARTATELSGVVLVLDEPSDHLDDAGVAALGPWLARLRDAGNTVLVVDHHPAVAAAADHLVAFGPGAGVAGGRVVATGTPADLRGTDTATGRALRGEAPALPPLGHPGPAVLRLLGTPLVAPAAALTVVTGPRACGKSQLVERTLVDAARARIDGRGGALEGPLERLVVLERGGAGRSPRSCVATTAELWTPIRSLLAATREARIQGFGAEQFSFNRPAGRCPACEGTGTVDVELGPLPTARVRCEACGGGRFGPETLQVRWRGLHAAELLGATVDEVVGLFEGQRTLRRIAAALQAVGLGYLTLGQRTDSLSGGEHQRLQLAVELARAQGSALGARPAEGPLLVVDAPAAGLHLNDVPNVVRPLQDLCRKGATVVAVAYHPLVVGAADHVIQLG